MPPEAVAGAIRPNTRMLWLETPCNPTMQLADIKALSDMAHAKGVRDVAVAVGAPGAPVVAEGAVEGRDLGPVVDPAGHELARDVGHRRDQHV